MFPTLYFVNHRVSECRPTRGQIPGAVLKCITQVRMVTMPKGGYEPQFRIVSGGIAYDSKDMINADVECDAEVMN